MQDLKARLAPVLTRWQNKLLAQALEAFSSNASASRDKRLRVQRALQYWNNRALVSAFAQWVNSVQVCKYVMRFSPKGGHHAKGNCLPCLS